MMKKYRDKERFPLIIPISIFLFVGSSIIIIYNIKGNNSSQLKKHSIIGNSECCDGAKNVEYWGNVVKSGTDLKVNSSKECCRACKDTCRDRECSCNTWVFCGNEELCGSRFGECWLKHQEDVNNPIEHSSSPMWTSGLLFGEGEGIIGMETNLGTMRIQLNPECSLKSVAFITHLAKFKHCGDCKLTRAESRGSIWDNEGNHISNKGYGPPFALIQGTLDALGMDPEIPKEGRVKIRRGSVAWVGSGPEFFVSLANHPEWTSGNTVFGSVLPEDMWIAEKIADLPTSIQVWNGVQCSVLLDPVPIKALRK